LLLPPRRRWQPFRVGISVRQFEQMQARLGGKPARTPAISAPAMRHFGR
jgi:hypothetical protein